MTTTEKVHEKKSSVSDRLHKWSRDFNMDFDVNDNVFTYVKEEPGGATDPVAGTDLAGDATGPVGDVVLQAQAVDGDLILEWEKAANGHLIPGIEHVPAGVFDVVLSLLHQKDEIRVGDEETVKKRQDLVQFVELVNGVNSLVKSPTNAPQNVQLDAVFGAGPTNAVLVSQLTQSVVLVDILGVVQ